MNQSQRALQIWPILINAAHNRQVLTYKAVGDLISMPPIAISQPLGLIMHYCAEHQLPPLTILVVNTESGQPGNGLITVKDLDQDREKVFSLNWYALPPLNTSNFEPKNITSKHGFSDIVAALLKFGEEDDPEELFPTLHPEAGDLIQSNPYAFAMAVCLDRGTKADIIWTVPYYIFQQLGHLDPFRINQLSLDELGEVISQLPKKPRYKTAAPRTIKELTRSVVDKYEGDTSRIWMDKTASAVNRFFQSIYGVGPGIANMSVLLIEKAYGIRFSDLDRQSMDIKPDVHTMRVLFRLGVSDEISENAAINATRKLNPEFPGEIDGALWSIGRNWCHAQRPACNQCPMMGICSKVGI